MGDDLKASLAERKRIAQQRWHEAKSRMVPEPTQNVPQHYFEGTGEFAPTYALESTNTSRARINEVLASLRSKPSSAPEPELELAMATPGPGGIPLVKDPSGRIV